MGEILFFFFFFIIIHDVRRIDDASENRLCSDFHREIDYAS